MIFYGNNELNWIKENGCTLNHVKLVSAVMIYNYK